MEGWNSSTHAIYIDVCVFVLMCGLYVTCLLKGVKFIDIESVMCVKSVLGVFRGTRE